MALNVYFISAIVQALLHSGHYTKLSHDARGFPQSPLHRRCNYLSKQTINDDKPNTNPLVKNYAYKGKPYFNSTCWEL